MVNLEIQIPQADASEIIGLLKSEGIDAAQGAINHFGGEAVVSLVIQLTPEVLAFIAGLYTSRMIAKKHISYTYKGLVIKGVSEKTLLALIKNAQADHDKNQPST
jgi:hypothetical protein